MFTITGYRNVQTQPKCKKQRLDATKAGYFNPDGKNQLTTLSFVILTYNTRELLRNCLSSIIKECETLPRDSIECRIVAVDNASSDNTSDMVLDEFPSVHLIQHSKNLGSAKGFNAGVACALPSSDFIVVMNSDVIILPGTINKMLSFLDKHKKVDGVSCALYNPDMTPQRTRTSIARILPQNRSRPFRSEFPGTGFAMYRAGVFYEVGGYDEVYYFYNEDLDWAARAKGKGRIFYFLPHVKVIHIGGGGRKHNVSDILKELYKANLYFYRRHYPKLTWLAYPILKAEIALRIWYIKWGILRHKNTKLPRNYKHQIKILQKAKKRMKEEYRKPSTPQIRYFSQSILSKIDA